MNKFSKTLKARQFSLLLLISIVFFQINICGQSVLNTGLIPTGSFSGIVELDQQSIHSGIYVYVEGTSLIGVTDANGKYLITSVPYGNYTLTAQNNNYTIIKLENQTIIAMEGFWKKFMAIKQKPTLLVPAALISLTIPSTDLAVPEISIIN